MYIGSQGYLQTHTYKWLINIPSSAHLCNREGFVENELVLENWKINLLKTILKKFLILAYSWKCSIRDLCFFVKNFGAWYNTISSSPKKFQVSWCAPRKIGTTGSHPAVLPGIGTTGNEIAVLPIFLESGCFDSKFDSQFPQPFPLLLSVKLILVNSC